MCGQAMGGVGRRDGGAEQTFKQGAWRIGQGSTQLDIKLPTKAGQLARN
jgi:hypothetical protein